MCTSFALAVSCSYQFGRLASFRRPAVGDRLISHALPSLEFARSWIKASAAPHDDRRKLLHCKLHIYSGDSTLLDVLPLRLYSGETRDDAFGGLWLGCMRLK